MVIEPSALFVHAVGSPVERVLPEDFVGQQQFIEKALQFARAEADAVITRYRIARAVAAGAALVTLGALIAATIPAANRDHRTLILTSRGAIAVGGACRMSPASRVSAYIVSSSLDARYVSFQVTGRNCPEISLAREDIVAVLH